MLTNTGIASTGKGRRQAKAERLRDHLDQPARGAGAEPARGLRRLADARLVQAARGRSGGNEGAPGSGKWHHVTYAKGLLMSLAILPLAGFGEYVQNQQGRIR